MAVEIWQNARFKSLYPVSILRTSVSLVGSSVKGSEWGVLWRTRVLLCKVLNTMGQFLQSNHDDLKRSLKVADGVLQAQSCPST